MCHGLLSNSRALGRPIIPGYSIFWIPIDDHWFGAIFDRMSIFKSLKINVLSPISRKSVESQSKSFKIKVLFQIFRKSVESQLKTMRLPNWCGLNFVTCIISGTLPPCVRRHSIISNFGGSSKARSLEQQAEFHLSLQSPESGAWWMWCANMGGRSCWTCHLVSRRTGPWRCLWGFLPNAT